MIYYTWLNFDEQQQSERSARGLLSSYGQALEWLGVTDADRADKRKEVYRKDGRLWQLTVIRVG